MFPRTDLRSERWPLRLQQGCSWLTASPSMSHGARCPTWPCSKTECSGHEAAAWDIHDNPKAATTHRVASPVNPSGSGVGAAKGQRQPSVLCVLVAAAEQERAAVRLGEHPKCPPKLAGCSQRCQIWIMAVPDSQKLTAVGSQACCRGELRSFCCPLPQREQAVRAVKKRQEESSLGTERGIGVKARLGRRGRRVWE